MDSSSQGEQFLVAVLATDGFAEGELQDTLALLKDLGATAEVISEREGTIRGLDGRSRVVREVPVDRTLDHPLALPSHYRGLYIPGGLLHIDTLRANRLALLFVREFNSLDRPIAFSGHAGSLLISAGIVATRRLACPRSIADDIRNAGGFPIDHGTVADGNWLSTAESPVPASFLCQGANQLMADAPMLSHAARNTVWRARMI